MDIGEDNFLAPIPRHDEFKSESQQFSLTHSHIMPSLENSTEFLNKPDVAKTTVLQRLLVSKDNPRYSVRYIHCFDTTRAHDRQTERQTRR